MVNRLDHTRVGWPDIAMQIRRVWATHTRQLVMIGMAWVLGACSPGSDDMLLDYQGRVSRVLELSVDEVADQQLGLLALPRIRSRDMAIDLSDQRIDLLDFLRLSNCAIGRVIGQRNSSLGKMAAPSQRLHLERDLLTLGPECVEQIANSQPQLSATLDNILQVKQQERMASWWNAWFTSKEWQQFINPSTELIDHGEPEPAALSTSLQAYDYALQQGLAWQQKEFQYRTEDMEYHQQQWLLSEALGKWLTSQRYIARVSYQVAELLEQRQKDRPICPTGNRTQKSEILHTVFLKFYVGEFQPYVSRVDRYGAELLQRIDQGIQLVAAPAQSLGWYQALLQERQQMRDLNMRHVKAWQATLRQCGLLPGYND